MKYMEHPMNMRITIYNPQNYLFKTRGFAPLEVL